MKEIVIQGKKLKKVHKKSSLAIDRSPGVYDNAVYCI